MRPFPLLATLLSVAALILYIVSVSSCHWLGYTAPNTQTYIGPFRACTKQTSAGIDEDSYVSNGCDAEFSNPVGTVSMTDKCADYRAVRAFLIMGIIFTAIAFLCYYLASFERIPIIVPRTHGIIWSLLAGLCGLIAWAIFIHVANYIGDPWVYSYAFGLATAAWVLNWLSSMFAFIPYPFTMDEERRKLGTRFDTGLTTHGAHGAYTGQGAGRTATTGTGIGAAAAGAGASVAAAGTGMMESVKHALGFGKKSSDHPSYYGKHTAEHEREHERAHYPRDEEHPYTAEKRAGTGGIETTGTGRERASTRAEQGPSGAYEEQQRFAPSTTGGQTEYERRPTTTTSTGYGVPESTHADTTGGTSSNTGSGFSNVGTGATYGSGTEYAAGRSNY